jgi:hypothetical protein
LLLLARLAPLRNRPLRFRDSKINGQFKELWLR